MATVQGVAKSQTRLSNFTSLNAMYTILTMNEAFFESTDGPAGRGIMTRNDNSITRIHVYSRKEPPPHTHSMMNGASCSKAGYTDQLL